MPLLETFANSSKRGWYSAKSGGPKATGGTIVTSGGYVYHTFTSNGTFAPFAAIPSAQILVVAGGGGSYTNGSNPAGAGAGGIAYASSWSFSVGSNAIVVGAGGGGATNGSDSTISTITAMGGGRSSVFAAYIGDGGSGGGAPYQTGSTDWGTSTQTSGAGYTGYGFRGGQGGGSTGGFIGGSGGGAGGIPSTAAFNTGATGGPGLNTWSVWASATGTGSGGYYAGGGGGGSASGTTGAGFGGAGGAGGGGTGGNSNGDAGHTGGAANTGGGAGGTGNGGTSRSGGSGIVIVRYAA